MVERGVTVPFSWRLPGNYTSTGPASLDGYSLLVVALPTAAVPDATVILMRDFLVSSGTLFLVGDYSSWFSGTGNLNTLLLSLGAGSQFLSAGYDYGCRTDGVVEGTHELVEGITTNFGFGASGGMSLDTDASLLASGPSGQVLLGVEQSIVFSTDSNMWSDLCGSYSTANRTFLENLYRWGTVCTDSDEDGFSSVECGGEDCDDDDALVNPKAPETWYDGVDSNCDGADDYDQDGDGFSAEDWGEDCDDLDTSVYPGAIEVWYDGVDQDCDGASDYDQDADGFDSADHGGTDCDDLNDEVWPGAPDEPYDGIIADCDAADEYDVDGDGQDSSDYGGTDCDDADPTRYEGAPESVDGVDNDCDGEVDEGTSVTDDDDDGWSEEEGDCADQEYSIHPEATEECDTIDNNCDGVVDEGCEVDEEDSDSGLKDETPDCGCASGPRSAPWPAALLALWAALLAVRRERHGNAR